MTRWLVVHYQRADDDYSDWVLHAWGDLAPGAELAYPAGVRFAGEDAWGRFAWVRLADRARKVGFLIIDRHGAKDVDADRWVSVPETGEIWVTAGESEIRTEPPVLPGPGHDDVLIHYRRPDGDYAGWGLHCWEGVPVTEKPRWGAPRMPARFDAFGAVFRVRVRPDAVGLRYVLHRGEQKDLPDDQRLDLTVTREVWLTAGETAPVRPALGDTLGPELDPARAHAVFLDRTTVALPEWFAARAPSFTLGGLQLVARPGGLFQAQSRLFPHLRAYRAYAVPELPDDELRELLRDRLLVEGRDGTAVTAVQIAGVLDDLYPGAATAELGPVLDAEGRPRLSVWAPTARSVELELFREPGDEPRIHPMTRDDDTGVWTVTGKRKWLRRWYRFRVQVWQPAVQRVVTTSVTDPYSVSLAVDSTHSQLIDFDDPELAPYGWEDLVKPPVVAAARMQISELSVRDFSVYDTTVPAPERGGFLAFTRDESAGMRHLRSLADAGLTHVHLLPVNDFATVPDRWEDQSDPMCDLTPFPPDSAEQQRAVMEVAGTDGFNWGYDPWHWTTPEGSYATDPDGPDRIRQMRAAVRALNTAGLRVVLDVVYNHTMGDGLDRFSVLDR
ncbi:MAG TPA: pullulanase-associated domain-containing protein, partial [Actinoplanes sp.]|nr:pullulanase-associated domain-containing protein [Actinoplanes sp.]